MPGYWRAHGRAKRLLLVLFLWVYCDYLQALYWIFEFSGPLCCLIFISQVMMLRKSVCEAAPYPFISPKVSSMSQRSICGWYDPETSSFWINSHTHYFSDIHQISKNPLPLLFCPILLLGWPPSIVLSASHAPRFGRQPLTGDRRSSLLSKHLLYPISYLLSMHSLHFLVWFETKTIPSHRLDSAATRP